MLSEFDITNPSSPLNHRFRTHFLRQYSTLRTLLDTLDKPVGVTADPSYL